MPPAFHNRSLGGTIMATAKPRKSHRIAANSALQAATRVYLDLPAGARDGDPACVFMDQGGTLFVDGPMSAIKQFQDGSVFVATIAPVNDLMLTSTTIAPVRDLILASERIDRLAARIRQAETESGRQMAL
jgi:hypothetical protein